MHFPGVGLITFCVILFQIIAFNSGLQLGFLGHVIRALGRRGACPLFFIIIIRYFLLKEISIPAYIYTYIVCIDIGPYLLNDVV